jgi:hypothetical protein
MARGPKDWTQILWKDSQWHFIIDDSTILRMGTGSLSMSVDPTSDLNAPGGYAQTLTLTNVRMIQNTYSSMTASMVTSSLQPEKAFTRIPMVRAGSILGLVLYTEDGLVKSGSLSASVTLDGANTAVTLGMNTGSAGTATSAKDAVTFTAAQAIGVSLTASSTYLCEPDVTSASFMAAVLVEM